MSDIKTRLAEIKEYFRLSELYYKTSRSLNESELERLHTLKTTLQGEDIPGLLVDQLEQALAREERYKIALEFYADYGNWTRAHDWSCSAMVGGDDHTQDPETKMFYAGAIARKALQSSQGPSKEETE